MQPRQFAIVAVAAVIAFAAAYVVSSGGGGSDPQAAAATGVAKAKPAEEIEPGGATVTASVPGSSSLPSLKMPDGAL